MKMEVVKFPTGDCAVRRKLPLVSDYEYFDLLGQSGWYRKDSRMFRFCLSDLYTADKWFAILNSDGEPV